MLKHSLTGIASALILAAAWPLAAQAAPDATIELSAGSFGAGAGYRWTGGTLHYESDLLPDAARRALENDRGVVTRLHPALLGEHLEPSLLGVQIALEREVP
jgi:hypothetical protein